MKAYGIPVQSYVFKPASASVTSASGGSLIGTFVKAESITASPNSTSATLRTVTAPAVAVTTGNTNGNTTSSLSEADSTQIAARVVSSVNVKQEMPDLEGTKEIKHNEVGPKKRPFHCSAE